MKAKKPRDSHKQQSILRAAVELFLKNGYSNTSMDAIALSAGVTKQTVYGHYQNKDVLFTEMVAELCRTHTPSKKSLRSKGKGTEAMLQTLGMAFLNMLTSKDGLAATRLVVAEASRQPKLAQRYYESGSREMLKIVADFIAQQNKTGKLHIQNPMSAASYFFSMLKGNYYLRTLLNIKPLPSSGAKVAHVRETVEIFMRIYGGSKPLHTRNVL